MRRRAFIAGLGATAAWPLAAGAQPQPGKSYRIGILEAIPAAQNAANLDAIRQGLRDLGYVEGQNLVIDYRSADGHAERFPELASELVRREVDLIVARGTPATRAAKSATGTTPVVMATMGDPGALVASFARPGGNITGVTTFSTELTAKRVELLRELVPSLARVALLHNMGNPAVPPEWDEIQTAAHALGLQADFSTYGARTTWPARSNGPSGSMSRGSSSGRTVSSSGIIKRSWTWSPVIAFLPSTRPATSSRPGA